MFLTPPIAGPLLQPGLSWEGLGQAQRLLQDGRDEEGGEEEEQGRGEYVLSQSGPSSGSWNKEIDNKENIVQLMENLEIFTN